MQQDLTDRNTAAEDRAQNDDPVVMRAWSLDQVAAEPEAHRDETDPLQQAKGAWQVEIDELVDEGRDQTAADHQQRQGVEPSGKLRWHRCALTDGS